MNEDIFKLIKKENQKAWFEAVLPEDLPWFCGHFRAQPLLPGVIQLLWVQKLADNYLFKSEHYISGAPAIKFIKPLIPNDKICLYLELQCLNGKKTVKFEYSRLDKDNVIVSSNGKINYKDK